MTQEGFAARELKKGQLRQLIQDNHITAAIEWLKDNHTKSHGEAEGLVIVVLSEENSTGELIDKVLELFLNTRVHRTTEHGYWVHSLSHFTKRLWALRQDNWIRRLNETAFRGAIELRDDNNADRLVVDFAKNARWDDAPAEFGLTPENLEWMDWSWCPQFKARIEAGRFESEEAFLRWKLHRPETHTVFDYDAQADLVNLEGIRSIVQQLQELGADTDEFSVLERDLLTKKLGELETKLSEATQAWQRERLEKVIQKTRAALGKLP